MFCTCSVLRFIYLNYRRARDTLPCSLAQRWYPFRKCSFWDSKIGQSITSRSIFFSRRNTTTTRPSGNAIHKISLFYTHIYGVARRHRSTSFLRSVVFGGRGWPSSLLGWRLRMKRGARADKKNRTSSVPFPNQIKSNILLPLRIVRKIVEKNLPPRSDKWKALLAFSIVHDWEVAAFSVVKSSESTPHRGSKSLRLKATYAPVIPRCSVECVKCSER